MKYRCSLQVQDPTGRLEKALATAAREDTRAKVRIAKKGEELLITIAAADAVALKGGLHAIVQLLEVDERMERIVHGRRTENP